MSDEFEEFEEMTLSPVHFSDISQEAEVVKLMGKKPSKRLLIKKASTERWLCFGLQIPEGSEPFKREVPTLDVVEALFEWSLEQSDQVFDIIDRFLEDPTHTSLESTLQELRALGVIQKVTRKETKEISIAQYIYSQIKAHNGMTKEDLIQAVSSFFISKRPAAAVRQSLRRMLRTKALKVGKDGVYRIAR